MPVILKANCLTNLCVQGTVSICITHEQWLGKSMFSWVVCKMYLCPTPQASLKKVALLDDTSRKHFCLASITVGPKRSQKSQELPAECQEWNNANFTTNKTSNERVYRIKVRVMLTLAVKVLMTEWYDFGVCWYMALNCSIFLLSYSCNLYCATEGL